MVAANRPGFDHQTSLASLIPVPMYNTGSSAYGFTINHTFAIPVYGAAPQLAALIESLRSQRDVGSEILITTSTPTLELATFAKDHAIPLHVNPQRIDIAADWNFAIGVTQTPYVTLSHQDDLFAPTYVAQLSSALRRHAGAHFAFCDYSEHTLHGPRPTNLNLWIKRVIIQLTFGEQECIIKPRDKLRLLSYGNPICCPSVMLNREMLADFRFPVGFQTNLDWMAWLNLARRPGGFVYIAERLVSKGIHAGSETTATIANRARDDEDRTIFNTIWPKSIAAALAALYRIGYRANRT